MLSEVLQLKIVEKHDPLKNHRFSILSFPEFLMCSYYLIFRLLDLLGSEDFTREGLKLFTFD